MGAFFGPLSAMAGLAANSRSQGLREAQLQQIAQLKAQGLLEENAAGAMNLKEAQRQSAAKQKILDDPNTPDEVKMAISLGMDPTTAMKQVQAEKSGAVVAQMLQVSDPKLRQAIWANAQQHDPSLQLTPSIMKLLGIGGTSEDYDTARTGLANARTKQIELLNKMMSNPAVAAMILKSLNAGSPDDMGGAATTGAAPDDLEEP